MNSVIIDYNNIPIVCRRGFYFLDIAGQIKIDYLDSVIGGNG